MFTCQPTGQLCLDVFNNFLLRTQPEFEPPKHLHRSLVDTHTGCSLECCRNESMVRLNTKYAVFYVERQRDTAHDMT